METRREEAAPTFPTWRRRLEQASEGELPAEVERFVQVLKAVGTPLIDESTVHFIYYDPEARQVALSGEMNQWDRRGLALTPLGHTGIFYRTLEFRGPARVEYKFIVDGKWTLDPFCPNTIDNGIGEQNSYFVVGDFRDPPELEWVSTRPHGHIEEFTFASEVLHNHRRVYVYLPPGYGQDATQRFPVLYVHDGGEYLTRARLPTILDNLIYSQDIPPLIAVMVDPVDRIREYWANEHYARFVETEFLPHIDGRYRTRAEREARGVMGASLGGLISTYLALSRPHLFSKVGGQSSALFLIEGDRLSALAAELRSRVEGAADQAHDPPRLSTLVAHLRTPIAFYFDVGKYEPQFIPAHRRLVPLLEAKGCPCLFQELPGGHNWTSWRAHLKDLLTFLWGEQTVTASAQEPLQTAAPQPPPLEAPVLSPSLDRRFVRFFNGWETLFPDELQATSWPPVVESLVTEGTLIFRVALPGVDPQEVGLLVVGDQLTLVGQRRVGQEHDNGGNAGQRSVAWFRRTFPLPPGVDVGRIHACYHEEVLEISLPAPSGMVAKRIPIEVRK